MQNYLSTLPFEKGSMIFVIKKYFRRFILCNGCYVDPTGPKSYEEKFHHNIILASAINLTTLAFTVSSEEISLRDHREPQVDRFLCFFVSYGRKFRSGGS